MKIIITKQDDRLDRIAHKEYGFCKGAIEAIYAANDGLAGLPILLPEGIEIHLPEIAKPSSTTTRLWD